MYILLQSRGTTNTPKTTLPNTLLCVTKLCFGTYRVSHKVISILSFPWVSRTARSPKTFGVRQYKVEKRYEEICNNRRQDVHGKASKIGHTDETDKRKPRKYKGKRKDTDEKPPKIRPCRSREARKRERKPQGKGDRI